MDHTCNVIDCNVTGGHGRVRFYNVRKKEAGSTTWITPLCRSHAREMSEAGTHSVEDVLA